MEVEFQREPGRQEPKIVLLAAEETPEVQRLLRRLSGLAVGPIPARRGEEVVFLPQGDILRFYTDGKGVCAQTAEGSWDIRLRLYELEERLDRERFVRISNGEIINLDHVTAVDLSLSGTICMTLDKTVRAYVSRRYVKRIKETLHLRGRGGNE